MLFTTKTIPFFSAKKSKKPQTETWNFVQKSSGQLNFTSELPCQHPSDNSINWPFIRINPFFPPHSQREVESILQQRRKVQKVCTLQHVSNLSIRCLVVFFREVTWCNLYSQYVSECCTAFPVPLLGHAWTSLDIALLHYCHTVRITQEEKLFDSLGDSMSDTFILQ